MAKFLVDLWLDGYETEEEMDNACMEFIRDQLNFSASSVSVSKVEVAAWISGKVIHQDDELSSGYDPLFRNLNAKNN